MDEQQRSRVLFPIEQCLTMAQDLLAALAVAHQHLVHRDIKPENIWVCDDGTLKIMDFGLALPLQGTSRSRPVQSVASAYYVAPEQLRGATLDSRSDQYSLAVVLYELFGGRVPAGVIKDLHKVRREVPVGVSRAIMRALSDEPEERYATTDEFLESLRRGALRSSRFDPPGVKILLAVAVVTVLAVGLNFLIPRLHLHKLYFVSTAADREAALTGEVSTRQWLSELDAALKERQDRTRAVQEKIDRIREALPAGRANEPAKSISPQLDTLHRELDGIEAEVGLIDSHLLPAEERTRLVAAKVVADTYLKEGKFSEAADRYKAVADYLQPRAAVLSDVAELASARAAATSAHAQWLQDSSGAMMGGGSGVAADKRLSDADRALQEARFEDALAAYREATTGYTLLVSSARNLRANDALTKAAAEASVHAVAQAQAARLQQQRDAQRAEYYQPGRQFRDALRSGGQAPLMMVRENDAVSVGNVTAEEFQQFVAATRYQPKIVQIAQLYRGGESVSDPDAVTSDDARAYVGWLSAESGMKYSVALVHKVSDMAIVFRAARQM
jgi:hypothetical protein